MLSSFLPWEYFLSGRASLIAEGKVSALYSYDPFLEKMALGLVPRDNIPGGQWNAISLETVDGEWFENRFFSGDLFAGEESYLFLQGGSTDKRLKEFVLSLLPQIAAKRVLFLCRDDGIFFKQLCESEYVLGHAIKAPPFWQHDRLFDLLCRLLKVGLPSDVREYLLDAVKGEVHGMVNALKIVKLNFQAGTSIPLEEVKKLVGLSGADRFKLARYYGNREFLQFYRELLGGALSFDEYRSLMGFLQNHLVKVYDSSHLKRKQRPSRYDRDIMEQDKKWKDKDELAAHIQKIAEWEILAKQKHVLLKHRLRSEYLRSQMGR